VALVISPAIKSQLLFWLKNATIMEMQTHLRHLRAAAKISSRTEDEEEKYKFMQPILWMNSRQRSVRDQFYRSYVTFSAGTPLKNGKLPPL
jgi:hypothetical protein